MQNSTPGNSLPGFFIVNCQFSIVNVGTCNGMSQKDRGSHVGTCKGMSAVACPYANNSFNNFINFGLNEIEILIVKTNDNDFFD